MNLRGHPLHPVLSIFPLALLAASLALDGAALVQHASRFHAGARFGLGAAVVAGLLSAIPGILDTLAYPRAARGVPWRHGVLNGLALVAMATGFWLRHPPAATPTPMALALSVVAGVLAVVAWRMAKRLTPRPSPA